MVIIRKHQRRRLQVDVSGAGLWFVCTINHAHCDALDKVDRWYGALFALSRLNCSRPSISTNRNSWLSPRDSTGASISRSLSASRRRHIDNATWRGLVRICVYMRRRTDRHQSEPRQRWLVARYYMCSLSRCVASPKSPICYPPDRHGGLDLLFSTRGGHTRARKSINRVKFVKLIPAALGICSSSGGSSCSQRQIDRSDVW